MKTLTFVFIVGIGAFCVGRWTAPASPNQEARIAEVEAEAKKIPGFIESGKAVTDVAANYDRILKPMLERLPKAIEDLDRLTKSNEKLLKGEIK